MNLIDDIISKFNKSENGFKTKSDEVYFKLDFEDEHGRIISKYEVLPGFWNSYKSYDPRIWTLKLRNKVLDIFNIIPKKDIFFGSTVYTENNIIKYKINIRNLNNFILGTVIEERIDYTVLEILNKLSIKKRNLIIEVIPILKC